MAPLNISGANRKNMIIFTSFKNSHLYAGEKFSVARYQPKRFYYTELSFLAAEDENGHRIKLRNTEDSIAQYKKAFRRGCKVRWTEIDEWLKSLDEASDYVLCCWCPYSQSSDKQLKETGSFACHTGLVAQLIKKHRPDIKILLDDDRENRLIKDWAVKSDAVPKPLQPKVLEPVREQAGKHIMFSRKLGERIILAENEIAAAILKNPDGYAVYTKAEAALLKGKDTETVVTIHNIKKVFAKAMVLKINKRS